MKENPKLEIREIQCPEGKRRASLLLEWRRDAQGRLRICSVSCDNPRLRDLDDWDWDCRWSCWGGFCEEDEEASES